MRRLILKGHIYGSELLAQQFTKPEHLWGRPMSLDLTSFTDEEGNPVMYAWATNQSPAGDEEDAMVQERIDALLEADPSMEGTPIPVDLVTVSGSGLDPEISPEAAAYQVHRIAQARGMSEEDVQAVIDEYTTGRFLGILCDLFDELPTVLYLPEGTAMTLLFRDVAYQQRDIIDCVGSLAAQVDKHLPLRFYGTTDSRETAELTIQMDDQNSGKAVARVRSVSGRPIGQMSSLGVHLDLPDSQYMEHLAAVVSAMTLNSPMVGVVSRKHEQFVKDCGLLVPTEGSAFTYFSWFPEISPSQCLYALHAEHKMQLWQSFLADRQQPKEFDWLWDHYYFEGSHFLLEWELALRMVLERLRFQAERTEHSYRVLDGSGQECHFDFTRGGCAEKVFLKLLFPVDLR